MTTKTTMVKFMLMVRPDVSFNNGQLHRKTGVSQLSNDMGLGLSDRVLKYVCVRWQYPVG